mmetsp:Transcript_7777/g.20312  ORF Transcript_7777/g.20312 Transcript_7777/m.20312 type:complete len:207 (-) Transcript_7777:1871-2491(-)
MISMLRGVSLRAAHILPLPPSRRKRTRAGPPPPPSECRSPDIFCSGMPARVPRRVIVYPKQQDATVHPGEDAETYQEPAEHLLATAHRVHLRKHQLFVAVESLHGEDVRDLHAHFAHILTLFVALSDPPESVDHVVQGRGPHPRHETRGLHAERWVDDVRPVDIGELHCFLVASVVLEKVVSVNIGLPRDVIHALLELDGHTANAE